MSLLSYTLPVEPVARFYFDKGSDAVSPQTAPVCEELRAVLAAHPKAVLILIGRTDRLPIYEAATKARFLSNAQLGIARAAAVLTALALDMDPALNGRITIAPLHDPDFNAPEEPRDHGPARRVDVYLA